MVDENNGPGLEGDLPPPPDELPPLGGGDEGGGDIDAGVPAVAAGRTKNIFFLVIILVVGGIVLFNLLTAPKEVEEAKPVVDVTPATAISNLPAVPPPAPKPPPVAPPLPPVPKANKNGPDITKVINKEKENQISPQRLKSPINITQGTSGTIPKGTVLEGGASSDGSSKSDYPKTTAQQVPASRAGVPEEMIAQGKIIDAILETAINTDLSGILRAEVSRDVYAEQGRKILIPKGSRLIGSYDTAIKRGQSRVYIIWNRVIRPDGIDMIISSPGSDQLGRAGVEGEVDNKYLEIFSNSILLSTIQVVFAYGAESITGSNGVSEKENTTGSVTTSGSPSDLAVVDAVNQFGTVVKNVMGDLVSLKPTITVDQGTRLKVFVNKDVIFPPGVDQKGVLVIR